MTVLTGRERLERAFRCEAVDRAPWVPFVGCHGGALLGVTATEYLKSTERLIEGVEAAIARYRPDGIPVAFDLQIEAEVLGCELTWADQTPPAVRSHPLANGQRARGIARAHAGVRPHQDGAGGGQGVVPPASGRRLLRPGDRSFHAGVAPVGHRHLHEDVRRAGLCRSRHDLLPRRVQCHVRLLPRRRLPDRRPWSIR